MSFTWAPYIALGGLLLAASALAAVAIGWVFFLTAPARRR